MPPYVLKIHHRTIVLLPARTTVVGVHSDVLGDVLRSVLLVLVRHKRGCGRSDRELEALVGATGILDELRVRRRASDALCEVVAERRDQVHDKRSGFGGDGGRKWLQLFVAGLELRCNLVQERWKAGTMS